jgi:D-alanyl-D-alanine carboxypeptidase (penicillin-binding protein 5/6)
MRFRPRRGRRAFLMLGTGLAITFAARPRVAPASAQQAYAGPVPAGSAIPPPVEAETVCVVDGGSGAVLMDRKASAPVAPASLTKIFTALTALQHAELKQRVIARFSSEELDPDGTSMGLEPDDEVTIEDLLYGLMLPSGNDAALVLARAVGGNELEFVAMMNRAAAANGLHMTTFVNPHGLDAPGHQTSAHDIAQVSRLAMRDGRFRTIVGARRWTVTGERSYTLTNRNPFLADYPGADGVKIGWTEDAGATIVASATQNGHRVLVALMDTPDRVGESAALMDWAFGNFHWPSPPIADDPRGA